MGGTGKGNNNVHGKGGDKSYDEFSFLLVIKLVFVGSVFMPVSHMSSVVIGINSKQNGYY